MNENPSPQLSQASKLSTDSETRGFDLDTGETWIYPTNLPIRDYQYNIVKEALLKNTLVSLPTGLGKTFIAAVIMFNFYRWYPQGKIVFMAPTRPLVKQQIDACYSITAIPAQVTAEMTGSKLKTSRCQIWKDKRVFFVTPQILQNDLETVGDLGAQIRCLVFDEAHRAKGNHAYCEVIRRLVPKNKLFRVLALSATPGSSIKDVQEIIRNLQISHLEFRSEESPDVKPYIFERRLETVVVPLGEKLEGIRERFLKILDRYARTLLKYNVIKGNVGSLSKGRIFMIRKEFQAKSYGTTPHFNEIMKTLLILSSLYHAFELLIMNGLRGLVNYLKAHIEDPLLKSIVELKDIVNDVGPYLGPEAEVRSLPDGSFVEMDPSTRFGHPKFYKLRDLLVEHFDSTRESSRAIVFFEYRECVKEAHALLVQNAPKIRPRIFVGQSDGVTQKMQINVVKSFRDGDCNTLLATSIGEEGLDVGDVDLIICFEISNKSPIRMIQRMGRTGRKREGRVVVLVTEGKEQQTLKDCMVYKNNVGAFVLNSKTLLDGMYSESPRMVPDGIQPKCLKLHITVDDKPAAKNNKKNGNLKNLLKKMKPSTSILDNYDVCDVGTLTERLPKPDFLWNKPSDASINPEIIPNGVLDFSKNLEQHRVLQPTVLVKHSKKSQLLGDLLQFAESKRFNLPMTQNTNSLGFYSQHRSLKQGDIRNMFASKATSLSQISQSSSAAVKNKTNVDDLPDDLYSEIASYLSIRDYADKECRICDNFFNCQNNLTVNRRVISIDLKEWIQPSLSIFDTMKCEDFDKIADILVPKPTILKSSEIDNSRNDSLFMDDDDDFDFSKVKFTQIENDYLCDDDDVNDEVVEKSFAFQAPENLNKILNKVSILEEKESEWSVEKLLDFFKLCSFEDLFVDNQDGDLDKTVIYPTETIIEEREEKSQILENPSPDIFEDSTSPMKTTSQNSVIENSVIQNPESPILCTFEQFRASQMKVKRKIFEPSQEIQKPNLSSLKKPKKSNELTSPISNLNNSKYFQEKNDPILPVISNDDNNIKKSHSVKNDSLEISDLCDLSQFGLGSKSTKNIEKPKVINKKLVDFDISDLCDLSEFGLSPQSRTGTCKKLPLPADKVQLDDICDLSMFGISKLPATSVKKASTGCRNSNYLTEGSRKLTSQVPITQIMSLIEKETTPEGKTKSPLTLSINKRCLTATTPRSNKKLNFTENCQNAGPVIIDLTEISSPVKSSEELSRNDSQKENHNLSPIISQTNIRKKYSISQRPTKIKAPPRRMISSVISSNSDDEFEEKSVFVKPKPKNVKKVLEKVSKGNNGEHRKKAKKTCEFIEHEAVLSENDGSVSEDEETEDGDFDSSFIEDESEHFHNTQLHAEYLKSVRSPQASRGKFKIPAKPRHNYTDIFSQPVNDVDNSYLNDTFCVDAEEPDDDALHDLSELEILEMKLKENKRKRKNLKTSQKPPKRRKLILSSDDSD